MCVFHHTLAKVAKRASCAPHSKLQALRKKSDREYWKKNIYNKQSASKKETEKVLATRRGEKEEEVYEKTMFIKRARARERHAQVLACDLSLRLASS